MAVDPSELLRGHPTEPTAPAQTFPDTPQGETAGGSTLAVPSFTMPQEDHGDHGDHGAVAQPQTATFRDLRGRRHQFEARRVRRLIRHIDPWSVMKLSLLFFICVWIILMIAAVVVWMVARNSGTVEKIESFVSTTLSQPDFRMNGEFLFRQVGLVGLILTLSMTLASTIAAVIFNLISDIIGGVWITVIEEETLRPTRPPGGQATLDG